MENEKHTTATEHSARKSQLTLRYPKSCSEEHGRKILLFLNDDITTDLMSNISDIDLNCLMHEIIQYYRYVEKIL